jgi:diacylglycerol kinase
MPDAAKALKSFRYAIQGVIFLFGKENNAKIHLLAGVCVVGIALFLDLNATQWMILILQIAFVMVAEAFNTAIEKLCDVVSKDHHPVIGTVKDIAAGGVLIAAISAVITGLLLFIPKLLEKADIVI